ncbi:UNKNOWN [Stylonychia lemnae]|uniref:Uncharacterized protein n=1 Tax=Stylonychia lemnae TaxID=5949 RepID=A0A078A9A4_STYLE|nr:UNKNOWN [Stylonychia lemnae]|eukprot:CDW78431.1 UNKNOWN [Stylonychia lemnae]
MISNPQANKLASQDFDIKFGQPYPKLGFKFSGITKKWQTIEPYKLNLNDSRRQSNMSQTSSQRGNTSTNVITTNEDTQKLKLIQEQKALIEKQIEIQSLEKARYEAQCNLLKVQLVQVMEQMQVRIDQIQKMQFNDENNMDISNISNKKLDDSDIIEPQKLLNQFGKAVKEIEEKKISNSNVAVKQEQNEKSFDDIIEEEFQRI